MNVNIHAVHFNSDAKLKDYVIHKINKLNTFQDGIVKVDVFLKLENISHSIKDKIVEISVHIPHYQFFVKHCTKSFERSFDGAFESLVTQVKRKKYKQIA
jgi:putative sigma-54 modulation protein